MQDALGVAGGAGGIDGISGVVIPVRFITSQRLGAHDLIPVIGAQLQLTAAVGANEGDAFRRVGILNQRPRCASLPYADHSDDRQDASGQVDQHKTLSADAVLL